MKKAVCISVAYLGLLATNSVYASIGSSTSRDEAAAIQQRCTSAPTGYEQLRDLIFAGVCRHPSVWKSRHVIDQRRATADASRSTYWPKLSASASANKVSKSVKVPDAQYAGYRLLGQSGEAAISLNWVLMDSGYTDARVDSDIAMTSAADEDFIDAVEGVMLDTVAAFYKYMNAKDTLSVAHNAVVSAEQVAAQATGRYRAGVGTVADYQFALADVAQANVKEDQARRDLDKARTELSAQIGTEAYDVPFRETTYKFPELPDASTLVERVLMHNAKLRSIEFQIASARERINAARALSGPTVSLRASRYAELTPPDTSSVRQRVQGWSVGLQLSVPLFDGFESSSNASAVIAEMASLQDDRSLALRDARKAIMLTYDDVVFGRRQIRSYKELVDRNAASRMAAAARYKAGVGPLTDLLQADKDFFANSRELARSRRLVDESSLRLFILSNGIDSLDAL